MHKPTFLVSRAAGSDSVRRRLLARGGIAASVLLVAGAVTCLGWMIQRRPDAPEVKMPSAPVEPVYAVRDEPDSFRVKTHLPDAREGDVSGSIDMSVFSPGRDLVYVDDARVWWESDNDEADIEDDHSMHVNCEAPFRRLVELVEMNGGTLEVHDAYRPSGVHNSRSLHREGRALDLTCDQFPLEKLAKLCWAAGFDWVYYEAGRVGNGEHIHCSVKR